MLHIRNILTDLCAQCRKEAELGEPIVCLFITFHQHYFNSYTNFKLFHKIVYLSNKIMASSVYSELASSVIWYYDIAGHQNKSGSDGKLILGDIPTSWFMKSSSDDSNDDVYVVSDSQLPQHFASLPTMYKLHVYTPYERELTLNTGYSYMCVLQVPYMHVCMSYMYTLYTWTWRVSLSQGSEINPVSTTLKYISIIHILTCNTP